MNTGSCAVLFTAIPRTVSGNQIFIERHELIHEQQQKIYECLICSSHYVKWFTVINLQNPHNNPIERLSPFFR